MSDNFFKDENDDEDLTPMQAGLQGAADSATIIAEQLRMMAAGDAQYKRFTYISPWIKNIWNAAADYIEENERKKLH